MRRTPIGAAYSRPGRLSSAANASTIALLLLATGGSASGQAQAPPLPYSDVRLDLGLQGVGVSGNGDRFRQYVTPPRGIFIPQISADLLRDGRSLHATFWQPGEDDQSASVLARQSGPIWGALEWSFSRFAFHPAYEGSATPLASRFFSGSVWRTEYESRLTLVGNPDSGRFTLGTANRSISRDPSAGRRLSWSAADLYVSYNQPIGGARLSAAHETRRFSDRDTPSAKDRSTTSVLASVPVGSATNLSAGFSHLSAGLSAVEGFSPATTVRSNTAAFSAVSVPLPGLTLRGRWHVSNTSRQFLGNGYLRKQERADLDLRYRAWRWLMVRAGLSHQSLDFANRAGGQDSPKTTTLYSSARLRPMPSLTLGISADARRVARDPARPPEDIGGLYPLELGSPSALSPLAADRRSRWLYSLDWQPTLSSVLSVSYSTEKRTNRYRAVDHQMNLLNGSFWSTLSKGFTLSAGYTRQTFATDSLLLAPWLSSSTSMNAALTYALPSSLDLIADWNRYTIRGTTRARESSYGLGVRKQLPSGAHAGVQVRRDDFNDGLSAGNSFKAWVLEIEGGFRL